MDFNLSEEHAGFADSVRRFSQDKLAAGALERAHSPDYPQDVARLLAEQGLLGIAFSEADGGQGGTLMHAVLAIQEVAQVCPKSADIVQAGNFGPIRTFVEYASAEQKARWLPDLLSGRTLISLGMTEPDAGSAVTELKTHARRDGDDYVINGSKVFSTHSPHASLFLIYVRFGPGIDGIGSVLIERGTPGFSLGAPSAFMSGEEWCPIYLENCRIPASQVLLGAGGFKKQISGFNVERLGNASRSLALGRHCFNVAREHVLLRQQFGRALCEFQGIQWKFAEMALKLESAQLLLYKAAMEGEQGLPSAHSTAMAKLACNQAGWEVGNEALQAMGAMGYSRESLVEYCVRRIRGWMIAGGSVEMLKNRIAEGVFERSFSQRPAKTGA
jgi:alkylation response protein AidB-like acyl-CoA dehydrogenase